MPARLNHLQLSREPFLQAGGTSPAYWFEFLIDGVALSSMLAGGGDQVGRLIPGSGNWFAREIDRLLLRAPPDTPEGRTMFYVCSQCGDLGCGAITAIVEELEGCIIWRDFANESDSDDSSLDLAEFAHVGTFIFDKQAYTKVLEDLRTAYQR